MKPSTRTAILTGTAALAVSALVWALPTPPAAAQSTHGTTPTTLIETPSLEAAVADGSLPPVAERIPAVPRVVDFTDREIGQHGGELDWIARRVKDVRIMNVYGYARLVGFTPRFELEPDILQSVEVEEGRKFTLNLRPGHKWSDGAPFTTEDFRYEWHDVQLNENLSPYGPTSTYLVDGEMPTVTVVDDTTIIYEWSKPNPEFLPALASARPFYIYAPSHYLKQFHADYADPAALQQMVEETGERNWAALHLRRDKLFDAQNTDLPVLQPWVVRTQAPAERFEFRRNPFFHRIDPEGRQLPYIDTVEVAIADSGLIPAKSGAGESDLQARSIRFDNYTFLRESAERNNYSVYLWPTGYGSEIALFPNMTASDPVWRTLNRDARFRQALSLGIDREEINQVVYFGLARPAQNTVLPASPFYDEARAQLFIDHDPARANALLDEIGLTERNRDGLRLLPDGRPLEIVVQTAGERSVEVDVLQLIERTWSQIGVGLSISPTTRDVMRTRVWGGDAEMVVWFGLDNGLLPVSMPPKELAPIDQAQYQWPAWGQFWQTDGGAGETPDLAFAERLLELYETWLITPDDAGRATIVDEMLDIHAEQVTSIGTVQGVLQPIVVSNHLHNVPKDAVYSWEPGAHFGMYLPDTFWLAEAAR